MTFKLAHKKVHINSFDASKLHIVDVLQNTVQLFYSSAANFIQNMTVM